MAVSIPGKIVKNLTIDSLEVQNLKDNQYTVVPTVSNDGNVSLDSDITVQLRSLATTPVGEPVEGTYPVLQRSSASWNFKLDRPFWGGWYRAHATVSYNNSPDAGIGNKVGTFTSKELYSGYFFAPPTGLAFLIEAAIVLAIAAIVTWYVRRQRDIKHIRAHWVDYTVKKDDVLASIAKDRHASWRKIARVNKLKAPYTLEKGQKLKVPPAKQKE